MSRRSQAGLTLIELMIVVAIVGILASVAVYMYTKTTRRAKSSEVPAVFAELSMRQEQYLVENGVYLSTGDESDMYPASPAGPDTPTVISLPATWKALKFSSDKTALYCSYVAVAGEGGDDSNIGSKAAEFEMDEAPATNWYYLLAECDFDGDDSVNSFYFTRSDMDGIAVQNQGK